MKNIGVLAISVGFGLSLLPAYAASSDGSKAHEEMMGAMNKMNQEMKDTKPSKDVDADYTQMMIQHHEAGIDMMKTELEHGTDPKMKEMTRKMIDSQKKELKQMQAWMDRKSDAKS